MSATYRGRNDARGYRIRERAPAPGPPAAGARRPTPAEQAAMHAALDRMLADERVLRARGHNPSHPSLYRAESVAIMDAVVDGSPVDQDQMLRVLALLDQYHRMVEAVDISGKSYLRAAREMRELAEATGDADAADAAS